MSRDPDQRKSGDNEDDGKGKDYLGRILIAFVVAAAFFWILTFIF